MGRWVPLRWHDEIEIRAERDRADRLACEQLAAYMLSATASFSDESPDYSTLPTELLLSVAARLVDHKNDAQLELSKFRLVCRKFASVGATVLFDEFSNTWSGSRLYLPSALGSLEHVRRVMNRSGLAPLVHEVVVSILPILDTPTVRTIANTKEPMYGSEEEGSEEVLEEVSEVEAHDIVEREVAEYDKRCGLQNHFVDEIASPRGQAVLRDILSMLPHVETLEITNDAGIYSSSKLVACSEMIKTRWAAPSTNHLKILEHLFPTFSNFRNLNLSGDDSFFTHAFFDNEMLNDRKTCTMLNKVTVEMDGRSCLLHGCKKYCRFKGGSKVSKMLTPEVNIEILGLVGSRYPIAGWLAHRIDDKIWLQDSLSTLHFPKLRSFCLDGLDCDVYCVIDFMEMHASTLSIVEMVHAISSQIWKL